MQSFDAIAALSPLQRSLLTIALWFLIAGAVDQFLRRVLPRLVRRTKSELDDQLLKYLHLPISLTVLLFGVDPQIRALAPDALTQATLRSLLMTTGIVVWMVGLLQTGAAIVDHMAAGEHRWAVLNDRTKPVFDITVKAVILSAGIYLIFLAWNINVTGWLASAGIVGIVVGLAAQESLANLVAGMSIVADAPYKLGDFLVLGDGLRGRVTDIGLRSTRILTNDGFEVTLPNSIMARAQITNESGGPFEHARVRCLVEVAYGTDLEQARQVLLDAARDVDLLLQDLPGFAPQARFRAFKGSGIEAEVLGWIRLPEDRQNALDKLIVSVEKHLASADIEIPYSTQVIHLAGDTD